MSKNVSWVSYGLRNLQKLIDLDWIENIIYVKDNKKKIRLEKAKVTMIDLANGWKIGKLSDYFCMKNAKKMLKL